MKLWRMVVLAVVAGCGGDDAPPTTTAGVTAGGATAAVGGGSGAGASGGISGGSSGASGMMAAMRGSGAGGASGTAAGASGTGSGIPATFETVKLVFGGGGPIMPCSAAPCHGVHGMEPPDRPLELPPTDDTQLHMNLTTYVSKACDDTRLVTPGDPAASALIKILRGPCGATPRMPYGCTAEAEDCIPEEYIAAVAQWIENGAPGP